MSTWKEAHTTCTRCGQVHALRIARGVHVGRAPYVRDDVLERRLHHVACACGATLHVRVRFEYTDLDRKQFVIVETPAELARWTMHEAELRTTMRQAFELGSPLVNELVREIAGRVVFDQEELREKLVVWDAGFEDGLVECIKLRAFASDPTLAAPGSRLYVDRVEPGDALRCAWFARAEDSAPTRKLELPAAWTRDAERDRASLSARYPELFEAGFVSVTKLLVELPRERE